VDEVIVVRLLLDEKFGTEDVAGQLETLAVTVTGVPLTVEVPV